MKKELKEALVRIAGLEAMLTKSEHLCCSGDLDGSYAKDAELIENELQSVFSMLVVAGLIQVNLRDSAGNWITFQPNDVWFDAGFRLEVEVAYNFPTSMSTSHKGKPCYFDVQEIQTHIDEAKKHSEESKAMLREKHANGEQLSDAQKEYAGIVQTKKAKKKVAKKKAKSSAELH